MALFPEAPDDETGHLRMAEAQRHHVAQVVGVELVVERLQVVLGDGEILHQLAKALINLPFLVDGRDGVVAEVALKAAAVRRLAFGNHVLHMLLESRGAIGIEGVLVHEEQLVGLRTDLATKYV